MPVVRPGRTRHRTVVAAGRIHHVAGHAAADRRTLRMAVGHTVAGAVAEGIADDHRSSAAGAVDRARGFRRKGAGVVAHRSPAVGRVGGQGSRMIAEDEGCSSRLVDRRESGIVED